MTRTKKRNNFTLSAESQKIVDIIDPYKKSRFVSEAIVAKYSNQLIQRVHIVCHPELGLAQQKVADAYNELSKSGCIIDKVLNYNDVQTSIFYYDRAGF